MKEKRLSHRLLIDCPDRPGLVHAITGVLLEQGLNITRNDEFVDQSADRFFMRTEFVGEVHPQALLAPLRAQLGESVHIRLQNEAPKKVVIFATKEAHCLGDLLIRHRYGELPIQILAVISNHSHLESLVTALDIPFHCISHVGISREAQEAAVVDCLAGYPHDFLVLAKYMRILTPAFIQLFPQRILNIHHSFLPAFIGANPYRQAFERGVKIIGATAHIVTDDLDEGPIIAQDVLPVHHRMSPKEMALAGKDVEKTVLARALTLLAQDRVFLHGNKTIIF